MSSNNIIRISSLFFSFIFFSFCFTTDLLNRNLQENLPNYKKEAIRKEVDKRFVELLKYLETVANKEVKYSIRQMAKESAISLFATSNTLIQVSKLRDDGTWYVSKEYEDPGLYFTNLFNLQYDKVELIASKIKKVSIDGSSRYPDFEAKGVYEQIFRGFLEGNIGYEDYTIKEVIFDVNEIRRNRFEAKIKSIKILYTKKCKGC